MSHDGNTLVTECFQIVPYAKFKYSACLFCDVGNGITRPIVETMGENPGTSCSLRGERNGNT